MQAKVDAVAGALRGNRLGRLGRLGVTALAGVLVLAFSGCPRQGRQPPAGVLSMPVAGVPAPDPSAGNHSATPDNRPGTPNGGPANLPATALSGAAKRYASVPPPFPREQTGATNTPYKLASDLLYAVMLKRTERLLKVLAPGPEREALVADPEGFAGDRTYWSWWRCRLSSVAQIGPPFDARAARTSPLGRPSMRVLLRPKDAQAPGTVLDVVLVGDEWRVAGIRARWTATPPAFERLVPTRGTRVGTQTASFPELGRAEAEAAAKLEPAPIMRALSRLAQAIGTGRNLALIDGALVTPALLRAAFPGAVGRALAKRAAGDTHELRAWADAATEQNGALVYRGFTELRRYRPDATDAIVVFGRLVFERRAAPGERVEAIVGLVWRKGTWHLWRLEPRSR